MKQIQRIFILIPVLLSILFSSCEELTPLGDFIYDKLALPSPKISSDADVNGYSNDDITITLTPPDIHPDAIIRYSIDRSDPAEGAVYTEPFVIGGHNTPILVKTVAQKPLYIDSGVVQDEFLILYDSAGPPVLSPAAGSYNSDLGITLSSSSSGAALWYTIDGTDPRNSGTRILYSGMPISLQDDGTPDGAQLVINAVSQVTGLPDSPLVSGSYEVLYETLSLPLFSPASAQSLDPVSVTMSSPDGAPIWYTSNGASPLQTVNGLEIPSGSATLYTGPININWSGYVSRTLKAACVDSQKRASSVQIGSYFYQIAQTAAPSGEIYNDADSQTVYFDGNYYLTNLATPRMRLLSGNADTRYFYTTDGSMPQIDVNTGAGTVTILNPDTLEFVYDASVGLSTPNEGIYDVNLLAVQEGLEASSLVQVQIEIDLTPPSPPDVGVTGLTYYSGDYYANEGDSFGGWPIILNDFSPDGADIFQWRWPGDSWLDVSGSIIDGSELNLDVRVDGPHNVEFRCFDLAGNTSSEAYLDLVLDTIPPDWNPGGGEIPEDGTCGYPLMIDNIFSIEIVDISPLDNVDAGIYLDGVPVASSVDVVGNIATLQVPSDLVLDGNYEVRLNSATDIAGNVNSFGEYREFTTGAIFWSIGGVMFKSPITPRPGWNQDGTVWWIDDSTPITDIEVANGRVYWSIDDSGGGRIYSTPIDQFPNATWGNVDVLVSMTNVIQDIEIWEEDSTIFFASRDDPSYTIHGADFNNGTAWSIIQNIDDSTRPYGLAGDSDGDLYWSSYNFLNIWTTHSASWTPALGTTAVIQMEALAVRYPPPVGSMHHLYGLISGEGGVQWPEVANSSTYIERLDLDHEWSSSYDMKNSERMTLSEGTMWGNSTDYGGDINIVDENGVSGVFIVAPTINGIAADGAENEYCAVFRADFDLTGKTKLYDPNLLGLYIGWDASFLHGAIAVMTE